VQVATARMAGRLRTRVGDGGDAYGPHPAGSCGIRNVDGHRVPTRLADDDQHVRRCEPAVLDDQLAVTFDALGELRLADVVVSADRVLEDRIGGCEPPGPEEDLLRQQPRMAR